LLRAVDPPSVPDLDLLSPVPHRKVKCAFG